MGNKLDKFLADNGIDHRRLVNASRRLERLRPEDRRIRLTLRQARKSDDGKKPEGLAKPNSGRPVTATSLRKALAGKALSGATKARILRAVNHLLELKKKKAAAIDDLFDAPVAKAVAKAETAEA